MLPFRLKHNGKDILEHMVRAADDVVAADMVQVDDVVPAAVAAGAAVVAAAAVIGGDTENDAAVAAVVVVAIETWNRTSSCTRLASAGAAVCEAPALYDPALPAIHCFARVMVMVVPPAAAASAATVYGSAVEKLVCKDCTGSLVHRSDVGQFRHTDNFSLLRKA